LAAVAVAQPRQDRQLMVQVVEILLLELVQHLGALVEQQMTTGEVVVVQPRFLLELQV
jgi:hypothetical protein